MDIENELNRRRSAPTEFWIGLALLAVATIIALILLNNDGRKDQRNLEDKTTFLKIDFYGKENIQPVTGA